ncbi:tetratricopeptide repeat protein [Photobacterium sanguinicancri]|uniref:Pilus assembly protein TadD n=1 Tax=Photobacterium sanguinicancri TaxID=875932 RepID=A0AAW7Y3G5_9GAMM|nr:pilus assembly protein TadD [Photobacterium sanguinicancri]MDO6542902.1 pilus assembly protein TadD [Photobacterium sanguinicancri]
MHRYKIIIPIILIISGCSTALEADKELQTKENILISSNDKTQLVQFYKQNLKEDDSYKLKLVKVYLDLRDVKSAELYTNTFNDDDYESTEYFYTMARLNYLKQNYGQSFIFLSDYRDEGGDEAKYYHLNGKVLAEQKRYDEAISSFEKSRQSGMLDSEVLNDIGVVYIMKEDYQHAVEILYGLYVNNPADNKLRSNLILASIKAGRNDIALDALKYVYSESEARENLIKLSKKIKPKDITIKQTSENFNSAKKNKFLSSKDKVNKLKDKSVSDNKISIIKSKDVFNSELIMMPKNRKFRIQVLATYKLITPEYLEYLKNNYGEVYSYTHELWNRYCIGEFESLDSAKNFMSSLNIKGAFVVDYTNKKHVKL